MWTDTTRKKYARKGHGLASKLTDLEYAILEPYLPQRSSVGRPSKWGYRDIIDAIFYVLISGCQWRMLPPQIFPPVSSVRYYYYLWRNSNILIHINNVLVEKLREASGREGKVTAGIIDSQSVKTASGGVSGYDAGKKIKGRKRHILTDTMGNLLNVKVHSAAIQDREGGLDVIIDKDLRRRQPFLKVIYADGGYSGKMFQKLVRKKVPIEVKVIKRSDTKKKFVVLPKRWIVEQTISILCRKRRLSKDYEYSIESAECWILWSSIQRSIRMLARC